MPLSADVRLIVGLVAGVLTPEDARRRLVDDKTSADREPPEVRERLDATYAKWLEAARSDGPTYPAESIAVLDDLRQSIRSRPTGTFVPKEEP